MSQPSQGTSANAKVQPIMDALITSYGSLAAPDFSKIYVTMAGPIHRNLIAELRGKGVNILETTDENDDVSTQLFATQSGDQVGLGLSGVGPFAAVVHQGGNGQYSWVTRADDGPTPLAKLVAAAVQQAGFQLLDRSVVSQPIAMNWHDGSAEVTLYQALFTDTDRIP